MPGAGKTMLASIVIDHLENVEERTDIGVAYLFCTYRDRVQQTPVNLVASLLQQLLQQSRTVPKSLRDIYQSHRKQGTRPSVDEIFRFLQSVIHEFTQVFVVVDALDEYTDADGARRLLLSKLGRLQTSHNVNLMATSRYIPRISQEFETAICLEIRASDANVNKYLDGRMKDLPAFVSRKPDLQATIKRGITNTVDGM